MEDKEKERQEVEQADLFQVTPIESPSKNYLVIENLQRMPNIFSRGLLYLMVLVLVSGLIYSLLAEIDIVATCRAVARPASPRTKISAHYSGYVEKILVSEGQVVEKDAPLFYMQSQGALIPKRDMTLLEEEFIAGELGGQEDSGSKKVLIERAIKNREWRAENRVWIVSAESAGVVEKLYLRSEGEYVREADPLCTILPINAPLYMDITVANKDIGFMEKDMEIKYKFDAFPYTDYGILFGKISAISPSAIEDRTLGLVYHVRGTLDMTCFEMREKKYSIKPGMTATAELVREKKSIFSILFKKLRG